MTKYISFYRPPQKCDACSNYASILIMDAQSQKSTKHLCKQCAKTFEQKNHVTRINEISVKPLSMSSKGFITPKLAVQFQPVNNPEKKQNLSLLKKYWQFRTIESFVACDSFFVTGLERARLEHERFQLKYQSIVLVCANTGRPEYFYFVSDSGTLYYL